MLFEFMSYQIFQCKICGRAHITEKLLKRHIKDTHQKEKKAKTVSTVLEPRCLLCTKYVIENLKKESYIPGLRVLWGFGD